MANSSINLSSLDFDTLKANFKEHLKTQSTFKDYNFDGPNISVLLDIMAYNSYLNSFYLNMIGSEMFLDSAQKYDSVVSHAKELNYVPRSAHGALANVYFTASTTGLSGKLAIPKGTRFSGRNSNGSFNFVTDQNLTFVSPTDNYVIDNLQIRQGTYFQDSFIVNYDDETQRFLLTNLNVDTTTLEVTVVEDAGANTLVYSRSDTLFGLNQNSQVYFLQGAETQKYEIVFGDGLLGRKPKNGATIKISYVVTNGSDGNGIESFTLTDDLGPINKGSVTASNITTLSSSTSGANQESIESVRFSAPRYFATQQRAVSSDDYSSLVLSRFGGEIDDIAVYGGQDLQPKMYGRVAVCIKPVGSTLTPNYLKTAIVSFLEDYITLPNRVIVTDPEYFYVDVTSVVEYNSKSTNKTAFDVKSDVINTMTDFSKTHLGKFGADFRYSKFVTHIDATDNSITSNDTKVKIVKKISPKLYFATSYVVEFNNKCEQEGYYDGIAYPDDRVFTSSTFSYVDADDVVWSQAALEDDALGNILVYVFQNNKKVIVNPNIGSINYDTGKVTLNGLKAAEYITNISLYLMPKNKDIVSSKNMILLIEPSDIKITVQETTK